MNINRDKLNDVGIIPALLDLTEIVLILSDNTTDKKRTKLDPLLMSVQINLQKLINELTK